MILSKLLQSGVGRGVAGVSRRWPLPCGGRLRARMPPQLQTVRESGHFFPPIQYHIPFPPKMRLTRLLVTNWELWPVFIVTGFAIMLVVLQVFWNCAKKVDIVFTTHSRDNVSRTMDLREPSFQKIICINQETEPWPEMQEVQEMMEKAHLRALSRAKACKMYEKPINPDTKKPPTNPCLVAAA